MPKPSRRRRPRIEWLEDRRVMATWGIPWADPQHLTASFVPDGTSVQGQASQLYKTLDPQLGAGAWEPTLLQALQTWAANSNINIGLTFDGGEPIGVAGPAQGDSRFGDIRISAEPLPADVVAITTPYSPAYGTLSGDMILNSNADFNPADPGSYDLYTVALHEAGHVFGFADSSDPSSFMYNVYQGAQSGLAPGAVPALQALYGGPRAIDALAGNAVSTTGSKPIALPNPSGAGYTTSLPGDLATSQDADYFSFKAPAQASALLGFKVQVQSAGISLLAPEVTVRDASGTVVATASAAGPLDGGTSVTLAGLVAGQTYTIEVQGATGDAFSVGSYELTVAATVPLTALASPIAGAQAISEPGSYDGSTPLTVSNQVGQAGQVDVYRFKTPSSAANGLTLNFQDWGVGLSMPTLTVYDASGNAIGSATVPNPSVTTVGLHVAAIVPNATYYVRVQTGTVNPSGFGTYQVSAAFTAASAAASASNFTLATPWFGSGGGGTAQPNTSFATAAKLQAPSGNTSRFDYGAIQGIAPSQPQQFYRFNTPQAPTGQVEYMTVSVQTLGSGGLSPWIGVFDANGMSVPAQVLAEQDGIAVVQVALPSSGGQFTAEVSSAQVGGTQATGNYHLEVTFGTASAGLTTLSAGTLAPASAGSSTAQASASLSVADSGLCSFVLSGAAANAGAGAILQMTILDSSGHVVSTLSTPASLAESMTVCLAAGNYTILIGATSPSGQAIPPLGYTLTELSLTDPIKGYPSSGSGGAATGR